MVTPRHATAIAALALACTALQAATPPEATALLDGALAEIHSNGLGGAAKRFNADGRWKRDGLVLVAMQWDGTVLAHTANGKLPGSNMLAARDASGRPFVRDAIGVAQRSGSGQVEMRWGNPVTRKMADATLFVRRVPGQEALVGTVVFK